MQRTAGDTGAGSGAGKRSPAQCVLTRGHPVGPPGWLVPWGPWGRRRQGSGGDRTCHRAVRGERASAKVGPGSPRGLGCGETTGFTESKLLVRKWSRGNSECGARGGGTPHWPMERFQSLTIRTSNVSFPGRQEPQHRKTVSQPSSELTSRMTASSCPDGEGRVCRAH